MQKNLRFLLAVLLLVCATGITFGQASVTRSNDIKVPLSAEEFMPCANGGIGELVQITAYAQFLYFQVVNKSHTSWVFQTHNQGASATGQTTGIEYVLTGSPLIQAEHYGTDGSPDVLTLVWFIHAVGGGVNVVITNTSHVTINADGSTTVTRGVSTVECR